MTKLERAFILSSLNKIGGELWLLTTSLDSNTRLNKTQVRTLRAIARQAAQQAEGLGELIHKNTDETF